MASGGAGAGGQDTAEEAHDEDRRIGGGGGAAPDAPGPSSTETAQAPQAGAVPTGLAAAVVATKGSAEEADAAVTGVVQSRKDGGTAEPANAQSAGSADAPSAEGVGGDANAELPDSKKAEAATATEAAPKEKKKFSAWFKRKATGEKKTTLSHNAEKPLLPVEKPRQWELQVEAKSFENVGADKTVDAFFAVSCRAEKPHIHKNHVRLLPEYTAAYILRKSEAYCLDQPVLLYDRKIFSLPYKELRKHVLRVDMWKVSNFSFNRYYGVGSRNLWYIANRDPNISLRIKKKMTKKETEERKKKRLDTTDVCVFECKVKLEEMFDFKLVCENWSLTLRDKHEQYPRRIKEQKCLTFIIPKTFAGNASFNRNCTVRRVPWTEKGSQEFYWAKIGEPFKFFGTRTSLSNKFFIVTVHSGNPVAGSPPVGYIGKALMGLTSVLDISVFKGSVKALDMREKFFYVGELTGSVRCLMLSRGETHSEDIPGGRPQQTTAATSVGDLDPSDKHLVVIVNKCEGLAVADLETGSSDPTLRVVFDNMVQKSGILKNTLRPVFNQAFYFPVRLFNIKCMERRYQSTALVYEYVSKGDVSIQVWDDDQTSADSLGFVLLPLQDILASKVWEKRTMRGKLPKEKADQEVNEFATVRKKRWFEKAESVRIYDGAATELSGTLPSSTVALIHFEAYFFPDYPEDLMLKPQDPEESVELLWKERDRAWTKEHNEFARSYGTPFPESIGALRHEDKTLRLRVGAMRRFACVATHPQTREVVPLCAFLVRIIMPEVYCQPMILLHWVNCVTFSAPPRQRRTGVIPQDGWKDPQYLMFSRMGPPQDHAILLCSVLLGCGKDAYVCKGTIYVPNEEDAAHTDDAGPDAAVVDGLPQKKKPPRLIEHVWVMTREVNGFVTFWEVCSREMYHLPFRHSFRAKNRKNRRDRGLHKDDNDGDGGGDGEDEALVAGGLEQEEWADEVPDIELGVDDIEALPTIGRMPRPKQKASDKSKGKSGRDLSQEKMLKMREYLTQAPNKALLRPGVESGTLVDWLPFESIDVCFNMENLYANHQNHHPACIMFDFDNRDFWSPLVKPEDVDTLTWRQIDADVLIDPVLRPEKIVKLQDDMVVEMQENINLYRNKRGYDTFFDMREDLLKELDNFLDLQERMRKLDVDHCPIFEKDTVDWTEGERYLVEQLAYGNCNGKKYNRYGTPFCVDKGGPEMGAYEDEQGGQWAELLNLVDAWCLRQPNFPLRKGKRFKGMPVHFSTADKELIRTNLMQSKRYCELLDKNDGGMLFTVHCKMFGMLGGVQSTWLYIGVQEPQLDPDDK
mmetsp:Transcript_85656/g.239303  ORF Transcript_85656/g.239303 Transcript_85656/m.239303 type:complete len:1311 (-) Transcript_85656:127-4059(-)|eukprot:CAMPEP_0117461894 /NCGR_PEP_ID=MMETSP0784-20121206/2768_1 /TAXON_ID=39447 /ORGANISM="" /LENGTH=1310 /DNA_ID=CAMNT_0005255631 /DNA_START=35 /DNA_END=3967 /DNA_ORIENTATION=+